MELLLQQEVLNTVDEECHILYILTHCILIDCILAGCILTDIVLLYCILTDSVLAGSVLTYCILAGVFWQIAFWQIAFWQVYAFEKEVSEVQEMVQRRATIPTGADFMYFNQLPSLLLLFAANVCFLPICFFYQFYL